ncbi:MAG: lytic transglycosylase domain-containing protein [Alphaproteobacteria bacterium]
MMATIVAIPMGWSSAVAQTETAAAPPVSSDVSTDLPAVLSLQDAAIYREIFDLQRDGDWDAADRLIARLADPILMGHVKFQRYMHPTDYRSSYAELRDWMADYADHPGASRIYRLALRRQPSGASAPQPPQATELPDIDLIRDFEEFADDDDVSLEEESRRFEGRSSSQRDQIRSIQRVIRDMVRNGSVTAARERLAHTSNRNLFDPVSYAHSLGVIAHGYYRYDLDDKAIEVAREAYEIAGNGAALASWWGGLAAFRSGDLDQASVFFEALSNSPETDDMLRSAGGFWASRTFLINGQPQRVSEMLASAARYPRTFYGFMASHALGLTPALDFNLPRLSETEVEILSRVPAVSRALALIEAGQADLADAEMRRFVDEAPPSFAAMLLALAERVGLADVAFQVGHDITRREGIILDAALYPVPGWLPLDGYTVDRALVFAVVRQESQFRTRAESYAGARGLMQLMPRTAEYIGNRSFSGAARAALFDASLNLSLGQLYIHHVLEHRGIEGNLLFALSAYNAGPGNLLRWKDQLNFANDPLLFIESIPSTENRNYVEHVISNFWIYRMRLGQDVPSLEALIRGEWPTYVAQDGQRSDGVELIPASTQPQ